MNSQERTALRPFQETLLVAAARALHILPRVRQRFRKRGWEMDPARIAIAQASIACLAIKRGLVGGVLPGVDRRMLAYALGAPDPKFRVPPMGDDPPEWSHLVRVSNACHGVAASEIVGVLELEDLLRRRSDGLPVRAAR